MYMNRMLEVGKAQNGFVVEVRVPFKPKKSSEKDTIMCCPSCGEKQYIAKDASEVGKLIEQLMPLLDADYTDDKEFDKAFMSATTNEEEDDD